MVADKDKKGQKQATEKKKKKKSIKKQES